MSLSIEVHLCKLIVVLPEDEVSVPVDEVERVPGRVGRLVEGAQRPAEPHVLLRRGGVTYSNDGRNSALGWVHYKAELIKCMSWRTRRISLPPGRALLPCLRGVGTAASCRARPPRRARWRARSPTPGAPAASPPSRRRAAMEIESFCVRNSLL